jgi:SAM-dependent methyltransferase
MSASGREDYGIDAPTVVRNLIIAGVALLLASAATTVLLKQNLIQRTVLADVLQINGFSTGIICCVMAFWMFASSRWLKQRVAHKLLDARTWRGDEKVLDVGCGRGLIAINAARRTPHGHVTGVDIWQERDLGGNHPQAIRANAVAANVTERVTIDTGDARQLPYADDSFDVVASMTVIHNIANAAGRAAAIAECWRVTRLDGQILIFDIRHARTYARQLRSLGAVDIRVTGPILLWGPIGWRFSARKPRRT